MAIRDTAVDALRGVAMLMVVLGHTITGCVYGYQGTVIFNIIWSLQMPLFFLISGYVTRYSLPMKTWGDLAARLGKRTCAYIAPWIVWSFVIRGLLLGEGSFLDMGRLLWNMDTGYWFLISLWTISCSFTIASFIGLRLACRRGDIAELCLTSILYLLFMGMLVCVGLIAGLSFLGIKLTLYYMPFFFMGYLFGRWQHYLTGSVRASKMIDLFVVICLAFWIWCIVRLDPYGMPDTLIGIMSRAAMSISGCVALCALVAPLCSSSKVKKREVAKTLQHADKNVKQEPCFGFDSKDDAKNLARWSAPLNSASQILCWIGRHSLEIYLMHSLLLDLLPTALPLDFAYLPGRLLVLGNFVFTVAVAVVLIVLINQNKMARKILWWKK